MQIQQSQRPDLKIVVMSATLDAAQLKEYMAPCEVLASQGRTFPVQVEYLAKSVDFEHDPVWAVATRECERVAAQTKGDILVFMPGAHEISRTVQDVQGSHALRGFICFPLHGELPPDQQDRAVARYDTRKIIVSTNVAETSLTIDGVTVVVDCGLARVARFDPHRGINTLLIEKISVAASDQRAGRAGRTAPGVCVRLWTEREHAQRPLQELPEVKRLDLAEVVLTLKASGIDDIYNFPWLEKPEPKALERAETLLADLGAIGGRRAPRGDSPRPEGADHLVITDLGRKMLKFPMHPRYARMFLAAQDYGCVRSVALMAALTQGRNFLLRNVDKRTRRGARGAFRRGTRVRLLPADARLALRRQGELPCRRVPPAGHPHPGRARRRAFVRAVPRDRPGRKARHRREAHRRRGRAEVRVARFHRPPGAAARQGHAALRIGPQAQGPARPGELHRRGPAAGGGRDHRDREPRRGEHAA
ncbi:MAG: helicase-related protein [Lacunisphaera sp.]